MKGNLPYIIYILNSKVVCMPLEQVCICPSRILERGSCPTEHIHHALPLRSICSFDSLNSTRQAPFPKLPSYHNKPVGCEISLYSNHFQSALQNIIRMNSLNITVRFLRFEQCNRWKRQRATPLCFESHHDRIVFGDHARL